MMPQSVKPLAEWCAAIMEVLGVCVIAASAVYALVYDAVRAARRVDRERIYRETRLRLARGILLGLELLVAADIIHTVAVELTFTSVGVLAIVVVIRTFLSFALEVELTGRWPWQGDDPGAPRLSAGHSPEHDEGLRS
jgi:uncharacterized membrane protein